jgi:hypothetical protein
MYDTYSYLFGQFSIFGIGIHVLVALFFAVHAIRQGRELYWLLILFIFPFLGSIVYFFAVYLPNSRLESALRSGSSEALKLLNPGKNLRDAERAYDLTPSVGNQMRVASALFAAGKTARAIQTFDACLERAPANDLDLRIEAAKAKIEGGQAEQAIMLLRYVRTQNDTYRVQDVTLLSARALADAGQDVAAGQQFDYLYKNFGAIDVKVEYAIWLLSRQKTAQANEVKTEIDQAVKHWPRHAKYLNKPLLKKLNQAFSAAK